MSRISTINCYTPCFSIQLCHLWQQFAIITYIPFRLYLVRILHEHAEVYQITQLNLVNTILEEVTVPHIRLIRWQFVGVHWVTERATSLQKPVTLIPFWEDSTQPGVILENLTS